MHWNSLPVIPLHKVTLAISLALHFLQQHKTTTSPLSSIPTNIHIYSLCLCLGVCVFVTTYFLFELRMDEMIVILLLVANHISFWDAFVMLYLTGPSFVAKTETGDMPLLGNILKLLQVMFLTVVSKAVFCCSFALNILCPVKPYCHVW